MPDLTNLDKFRMSLVVQDAQREAARSEAILQIAAEVLDEHEQLIGAARTTFRKLTLLRSDGEIRG